MSRGRMHPCRDCGTPVHIQSLRCHPCLYASHGTASERVMRKVDRSAGPDACWPFMGQRDNHGYGHIKMNHRLVKAHRAAWESANGPIPPGLHVLHSCDNPPCCNPAHLRVGTHAENMRDMAVRRRAAAPGARLTEEQVRAIRRRLAAGERQSMLAAEYGVDRSNVSLIASRRTWAEVA